MFDGGEDPEAILRSNEFSVISDIDEIRRAAEAVVAENPAAAADYRKGKVASMQFLIGKAMGMLNGRAHPDGLRKIFEEILGTPKQ